MSDQEEHEKALTRARSLRYRERLRESGLREILLWVTPKEERAIRKLLKTMRGE